MTGFAGSLTHEYPPLDKLAGRILLNVISYKEKAKAFLTRVSLGNKVLE